MHHEPIPEDILREWWQTPGTRVRRRDGDEAVVKRVYSSTVETFGWDETLFRHASEPSWHYVKSFFGKEARERLHPADIVAISPEGRVNWYKIDKKENPEGFGHCVGGVHVCEYGPTGIPLKEGVHVRLRDGDVCSLGPDTSHVRLDFAMGRLPSGAWTAGISSPRDLVAWRWDEGCEWVPCDHMTWRVSSIDRETSTVTFAPAYWDEPPTPAEDDCECKMKKYGFIGHAAWCPDFIPVTKQIAMANEAEIIERDPKRMNEKYATREDRMAMREGQ